MRSERAYSRWISFVLVLFAIAIALLVGWLAWRTLHVPRSVVHDRTGPTLVIQVPPLLTPLQAKRAKRTAAAKSPDSATPHRSGASTPSTPIAGSVKSPTRPTANTGVPAPKKRKTTTKPRPTPAQSAPSPPQTTSAPPPAVTVPLPSVCVPPIKIGTCP